MNNLNRFRKFGFIAILFTSVVLTGCDDDDDDEPTPAPPVENEVEVITDVTLMFVSGTDTVRASAKDPDGSGVQELVIQDTIRLDINKSYTLTYSILNALDPADVEDIGDEIRDEDDEHQIFYSFTNNAFMSPMGDGNIDAIGAGTVNYNDEDSDAQDGSGNPVGLNTSWMTSGNTLSNGSFRTVLKHQPNVKTSTSTFNDGDTDFDLEFVLEIN